MRRQQIMQQYATHLSDEDTAELARATEGMSGRDLRDIAEQSERRTASKVKHDINPPSLGKQEPCVSGIPVTCQAGQAQLHEPGARCLGFLPDFCDWVECMLLSGRGCGRRL